MYPASLLLSPPDARRSARRTVPAPDTLTPTFALMREALHQALQLRFTVALEVAMRLEQPSPSQHLLEAQLMRGIIAYFQRAGKSLALDHTPGRPEGARHAA